MKQIVTLFFLLAGFTLYSQQRKAPVQSSPYSGGSKEDVYQKPPAGEADITKTAVAEDFDQKEITMSNWDNIAAPAKKLYSREQILHFSKSKLNQVNFLCTKSFIIMNENKTCPFNADDLDMNEINKSRQLDQRTVMVIKQKDCVVKLELLTIKEVEAEYNKIK